MTTQALTTRQLSLVAEVLDAMLSGERLELSLDDWCEAERLVEEWLEREEVQ